MNTDRRQDIVIEIPTGHLDLTDIIPSKYHASAGEYYNCYINYIKPERTYSPVPYTLLLYAIELELKASLLKYVRKGSAYAKKYSHNFIKLYENLCSDDKILTSEEFEVLKKAGSIWSDKKYGYFLPIAILSHEYMPDLKILETITVKLIDHGNKIHNGIDKWY